MGGSFGAGDFDEVAARVVLLGTHHEQQHQELLLTDIKHALWCNPLGPAYRDDLPQRPGHAAPLRWIARDEAVAEIGAAPWPRSAQFAYDNESPRSEEHTSELQSLMRISYAVFCLKKKKKRTHNTYKCRHTTTTNK